MNIKPILFNTEMVRTILVGRKRVTRRVVKPQYGGTLEVHDDLGGIPCLSERCGSLCRGLKPPYYPGDILYVRETWQHLYIPDRVYIYKADSDGREERATNWKGEWRPSIHMPRNAARIFLRVTDVRVERLQKITIDDIQREGIVKRNIRGSGCCCVWKTETCMSKPCSNRDAYEDSCWTASFSELWNSTIKPADRTRYSWNANPWVWVIEFERISKEDAIC